MDKNIFENAKFGDKFLTRDGKIALFDKFYKTSNEYHLYIEDGYNGFYSKHGDYINEDYPDENYDIVSRYHEPIDFDKLHELANKLCPLEGFSNAEEGFIDEREDIENSWVDGFKAGYRKAKEE